VPGATSSSAPRQVEVLSRECVLDDFIKVERARLRFERYDGRMSAPMTRLVLDRGDAVAVLLYDRAQREVVLVQQFRYAAYLHGGPGWLWEVVAGIQEEGRTPEEVARAEALEEAGYQLTGLLPIMTYYPSPGSNAERLHLFLAPITSSARVLAGGGLQDAGEDTLCRVFPLDEALRMAEDGRIVDGKTALALLYLARHWDEL
jgi:nudix-type nucleoside diphosphatase (YffH/AdpP family)